MRTRPGRVCATREEKKPAAPAATPLEKAPAAVGPDSRDAPFRKKAKEAEWIAVSSTTTTTAPRDPRFVRPSVRPSVPSRRRTSTGQRVKVIAHWHVSLYQLHRRSRAEPVRARIPRENSPRSDLCRRSHRRRHSPTLSRGRFSSLGAPVCFPSPGYAARYTLHVAFYWPARLVTSRPPSLSRADSLHSSAPRRDLCVDQ